MLRLIHAQTVQGALLVDDIDDGLPNKPTHRIGSVADPNAYGRDGYSLDPKQRCYIPRVKATDPTIPGYIDLEETERVILSAGKGKVYGLRQAGLIAPVVSFVIGDLAAPAVTGTTLDLPAAGDVTIGGSGFLSVTPEVTTVHLFGAGVGDVTLTKTQIEAVAPGAVTDTSIVIDSTLITGLAEGDSIVVRADAQNSNTWVVPPTITTLTLDSPAAGDLTIDGAGLNGTTVVVHLYGAGVGDVSLSKAAIIAVPPGAVGAAQIIIDSTLIASLATGDNVTVTVNGVTSLVATL